MFGSDYEGRTTNVDEMTSAFIAQVDAGELTATQIKQVMLEPETWKDESIMTALGNAWAHADQSA